MPNASFSLADRLILFRYFNSLLGAKTFEELQAALKGQPPGYDAQGHTHFFNVLKGRATIPEDKLARYDNNIGDDVDALNRRRLDPIQLKYFQYLAALYTEIYLDRRANDRAAFLHDLNQFVAQANAYQPYSVYFAPFTAADLKKRLDALRDCAAALP